MPERDQEHGQCGEHAQDVKQRLHSAAPASRSGLSGKPSEGVRGRRVTQKTSNAINASASAASNQDQSVTASASSCELRTGTALPCASGNSFGRRSLSRSLVRFALKSALPLVLLPYVA